MDGDFNFNDHIKAVTKTVFLTPFKIAKVRYSVSKKETDPHLNFLQH